MIDRKEQKMERIKKMGTSHLITAKPITSLELKLFGEVGGGRRLQLCRWTYFAKIKIKRIIAEKCPKFNKKKSTLAAPRLALRFTGQSKDWSTQCQDNVTGCGIMSSTWGMILQCGSTMKVSIVLPVTTRHRRDMTEKLLTANKQQQRRIIQAYLFFYKVILSINVLNIRFHTLQIIIIIVARYLKTSDT